MLWKTVEGYVMSTTRDIVSGASLHCLFFQVSVAFGGPRLRADSAQGKLLYLIIVIVFTFDLSFSILQVLFRSFSGLKARN